MNYKNHLIILFFFFFIFSPFLLLSKTYTIVIIRYRIEPDYFNNTVKSFIKTLKEHGFIPGKNLKIIDVITQSANIDSVPEVYETVKKYKKVASLFITCGWISLYARKILKNTNIPQLFVPVLKSVALKLVKSVKSPPHTNISGVYLQYPPEKILRITKLILKNPKSYGYVYDSRIPADVTFKKAYESLSKKSRHGIKVIFFDLKQGINTILKKIKNSKVSAIGGIVGAFKNLSKLDTLNIPIITSFTLDIEKNELSKYVRNTNIVAGLFNPFSYCGFQAGLMAIDILKGKKKIQNMKPRPAKQIAFINLNAANRLKIKISFKALDAVDILIK